MSIEDRKQNTEVRRQKAEGRSREAAGSNSELQTGVSKSSLVDKMFNFA